VIGDDGKCSMALGGLEVVHDPECVETRRKPVVDLAGGVWRLRIARPGDSVAKLPQLIPTILFLCSDASSYMTGSNLAIDDGRTCW
jgi:NAD(P)-dependent dehydrogenase (short-subunit alcohol dehydrogenase family)